MSDDIVARLVRRVEELRKYQRIAAELSDKFNGTPCAEIRWQQELDAAIARAEAAERERDWHKSLTQSHDLLADNSALKARADAAEAAMFDLLRENKRLAKSRDRWGQRYNKILLQLRAAVMTDTDYIKAVDEACENALVERDAAVARAEAAEAEVKKWKDELREADKMLLNQARTIRERDEAIEARDATRDGARVNTAAMRKAVELAQEYKSRAEAAEAKVAKLRGALAPFVAEAEFCDEQTRALGVPSLNDDDGTDVNMGDLRRARTALQETEQ